jgi:hypothetical protein
MICYLSPHLTKYYEKGVVPMDCVTVKPGIECMFMSKTGCSFNGGTCHQVVDKCHGCDRMIQVDTGAYCRTFPDPVSKWKRGTCNFATHVKTAVKVQQKINPLKASKRESR